VIWPGALTVLLAVAGAAQVPPRPPSALSIRPAVLRHFTADEEALAHYLHLERVILTKDGRRSERTVRVYYVNGRAVATEIALGGKPLGPKGLAAQHRVAAQRAAQLALRPPPRPGMLEFQGHDYPFAQLAQDFDYGPGKVVQWHGRTTWVYPAYPNPNAPHRSRAEDVLLGSEGSVWIDARNLHLVRVKMHTFRPVKYFGGLLATVHAASLDLQLEPVAPAVWLPRRIAFQVNATILLFKQLRESKIEAYWGYQLPARKADRQSAGTIGLTSMRMHFAR
ncbi:MAG: hypothetical protein ACRD2F_13445, partial [Terriglobales bacterium]